MKALAAADFPEAALTRAGARASVPYLPDGAFEARWKAAIAEGPLKLVRSFPALWWRDLRAVDPARVPAGKALAFGDAHVENFGFLAFDRGPVGFAFNDLDDSGEVEVALDALRYFTTAALWRGAGGAPDVPALVRAWAEALDDERDAVITDPDTLARLGAPERKKMRANALERWSTERLLAAVTKRELEAVRDALRGCDETRGYAVHAVRRRVVPDGGSGGLDRFWALARVPDGGADDLDVIELKARAPAAAEEGGRKVDKRLSTMKKALWPGRSLTPYHRLDVTFDGAPAPFVARSRGARGAVKAERGVPFAEQARVLAAVHGRARVEGPRGALAEWVAGSVPALVARWEALHARG